MQITERQVMNKSWQRGLRFLGKSNNKNNESKVKDFPSLEISEQFQV